MLRRTASGSIPTVNWPPTFSGLWVSTAKGSVASSLSTMTRSGGARVASTSASMPSVAAMVESPMSPPTRGNVMVLYLDQSIQHAVEQVLNRTVESYQAKSGSAIVMNVQSGEVLAMASYPGFNPNSYNKFQAGELSKSSHS